MRRTASNSCLPVRTVLCVVVGLFLSACGGIGAPIIRSDANDGDGPYTEGCQNVSSATQENELITGAYMSTWTSAWGEGVQAGVQAAEMDASDPSPTRSMRDGLKSQERVAVSGFLASAAGVSSAQFSSASFCRGYPIPVVDVVQIVAELLPKLGNGVEMSDVEYGQFKTKFAFRSHATARWKDQYLVEVKEESTSSSSVKVFRDLYIDRKDGYGYAHAKSSGHNEAWLLTQIENRIKVLTGQVSADSVISYNDLRPNQRAATAMSRSDAISKLHLLTVEVRNSFGMDCAIENDGVRGQENPLSGERDGFARFESLKIKVGKTYLDKAARTNSALAQSKSPLAIVGWGAAFIGKVTSLVLPTETSAIAVYVTYTPFDGKGNPGCVIAAQVLEEPDNYTLDYRKLQDALDALTSLGAQLSLPGS